MPHHRSFTALSRRDALRTLVLTAGAAAAPGLLFSSRSSAASPSPTTTPTPSPPEVKGTTLGGNFRLITGAGGNIVSLSGDQGMLVVDSGVPQASARLLTELSPGSTLAFLINTHWHQDHTGGNAALAKAGGQLVAHENCRKWVSTDHNLEPFSRVVPALEPAGLPQLTFTNDTTLHLNGETIRLLPVAPAHTDSDVVVCFEKADLVHAGDLYFNGTYPFIDWSTNGWVGGMVEAIRKVANLCGEKTRIVPGHGPLATPADLKNYLAFLETAFDRLGKFKTEGKNIEEVVQAAPFKDFDDRLGKGFLNGEKFTRIAYTGLLKHHGP